MATAVLVPWLLLMPGGPMAQEPEKTESQPPTGREEIERLERRIAELERAKAAQEEATRAIIRQAVESSGSKINNVAAFGGTFELVGGRTRDLAGATERVTRLNTLECVFEVQVDEWTLANFVLQHNDGADILFPTVGGTPTGVPRIDLDTAILTLGNTGRFPPFATFGRMILPFGISTGDPVADVLTLEDPLTVEAFEMREEGILLGFGLPTPPATPRPLITSPPPVRPRAIQPALRGMGRRLGYRPPPVFVPGPTLMVPATPPAPLTAGVLFFRGNTSDAREGGGWSPEHHIGATVGFRTTGPKSFDVDLDFNSSVFDSRFLESEYRPFLDQIGLVPGMAASLKAKLGPLGVVTEWNGAVETARFTDGRGQSFAIRPRAWQVSLGYQFDWNPGVESIGAQGTYLAVGYSRSRDLAGVTAVIDGEAVRVGAVPRSRFLVSAGEWILEGVRVAVEYSHVRDYAPRDRGTGKAASAVFWMLTYDW